MSSSAEIPRNAHLVRLVLCGSFLVSLVLSLVLQWRLEFPSRALSFFQVILMFAVLTCWFAIPFLNKLRLPVNWMISIAVLNLMIVTPELFLRAVEFRYESGKQFGYPRPSHFVRFVVNQDLFWTYNPAQSRVNSWGFREREFLPNEIPSDITRVLFLGDSCTEQGYPKIVEDILNKHRKGSAFDCFSLAISGYSSYQGRKISELYGSTVDPDIVVVFFGWNDHWLAYGDVDSNKTVDVEYSGVSKIRIRLLKSRLFQAIIFVSSLGRRDTPVQNQRVSLDEYFDNLVKICDIFETDGARVILITAPTSHYKLGIPGHLTKQGFITSENEGKKLHKDYNNAVRRVHEESHSTYLCDLEKEYARMTRQEMNEFFMRDGIHFTLHGMNRLAEDVAAVILEVGIVGRKGGDSNGNCRER